MDKQDVAGAMTPMHSCEICGLSELTESEIREHTKIHVEGNAQCPFCGITSGATNDLLLHVNQAHLDYLTPENELMSFIDDQSPSSYFSADGDGDDSDSCLDDNLPGINNTNGDDMFNEFGKHQSQTTSSGGLITNGFTNHAFDGTTANNVNLNHYHQNGSITNGFNFINANLNNRNLNHAPTKIEVSHVESSSSSTHNKNNDIKNCDMNGGGCSSKDSYVNGLETNPKGGQGSPLRSQLGLKLKTNAPAKSKPSPLQCPLCPYVSDHGSVLEEHINRSHFDPISPSVNGSASSNSDTLSALACPICSRVFNSGDDLELHVNIEHRDILSPGKIDSHQSSNHALIGSSGSICPVCNISLKNMKTADIELHIEGHFSASRSPSNKKKEPNLEKQARKLQEEREFEMLRAQYGMDDQGNFREQSSAAMQRAVYAGEMSVADYYERQVGLKAAESHGIDDNTSCTRSIAPRVMSLSSTSNGVIKSFVCSAVDHYASSYGDKGWGCGYRNLQMLLSSLLQNTTYNEAIYSAWGNQGPSRTAMPSISRLQKMCEAAWAQGFDVQGSDQLGCKLYNTRKWIGATEVMTLLSWLRINCYFVDFHRPTTVDGKHPELFNWVMKYFEEARDHVPPLYLQHQGHSRTIVGIEQRSSGLTLLVLDPSSTPREVAALGSSQDSLRLIRRGSAAMRAPQYQIVAVKGLIETEQQYQASKVLRSLRIPPDR